MGVIDCLSAGFRYVGWRLELIVIPIVMDLLLWFAPRFNVSALFDAFAQSYSAMATAQEVRPDLANTVQQLAAGIREMGKGSNLLNGLVTSTLLHVPSLPYVGDGRASQPVIDVTTMGEAIVLWVVFALAGLLIGVVYLTLLARRLPIGSMANAKAGQVAVAVFRHWLQVIGFVLLTTIGLAILYLPISFLVGLMMLASPAIGSAAAALAGGITLIIFFYLYFVVAALIMDNIPLGAAVTRSIRLVQANFWSTLGFILLTNFIGLGITLLLVQLAGMALWSAVLAIVINAYIGTGLSMALLVFYRTRMIAGERAAVN